MYKLSVFSMFKNETHCLKEWIEHYIFHGVEHFYLINDNSDDNFLDVLTPYIEKGIVTLFNARWDYYLGRQKDIYNFYVLPRIKESKWLLMVDMDEFMWSPREIDMKKILDMCNGIGQIQVEHTLYGSNGCVKQPKYLVQSFTKRSIEEPTTLPVGNRKYFINNDFEFTSLNAHHATFLNKKDELEKFILLGKEYFIMNHYNCQSSDFWNEVKCKRGDSDNYSVRTPEDFNKLDLNEVEDLGLFNQNSSIFTALDNLET